MYKNPEMSAQAKILARELNAMNTSVTHAQALELMAKTQGARTLHVLQASKAAKETVDIATLALQQACDLMFTTLGRFEGNVQGLLDSIETAFTIIAEGGSRAVEAEVERLFGGKDAPEVSELYMTVRLEQLPGLFKTLHKRLMATLSASTGAPRERNSKLYSGPMLDWRLHGMDPAGIPEEHRTPYEVDIQREGYQLYVDVSLAHEEPSELEGTDQLSLFIEVNDGRPCVHISNDRYGDQVLTVFATKDGLYLRPEGSDLTIRREALQADSELAKLREEQGQGMPNKWAANHAVIEAENY